MNEKKLTLEEIDPNMFVTHIQDEHENLIYFVTHKGGNDPKELYGWSIYLLKDEPARLLVKSPYWRFFCHGDGNYYRLLTEKEKREVAKALTKKWEETTKKFNEIINNL